MARELLDRVTDISSFSPFLPFLIGLIRFKSLSVSQRLLLLLIIFSIVTERVAQYLIIINVENLIVYNLYAMVNFNLLLLIYKNELPKSKRKIFLSLQIAFNLLAILNAAFLQSPFTYNSNLLVAMSIGILAMALAYFNQLLRDIKYTRLEKNPIFWLNSGITIYYSGTLVLFFLSNQIIAEAKDSYDLYLAAWGMNSIFNLILMISYSIALWVRPTK